MAGMRARWVGRGAGGRRHGSGAACFPSAGKGWVQGRAWPVGAGRHQPPLSRWIRSGVTQRGHGCHQCPSWGDLGRPGDRVGSVIALGGRGRLSPGCHHHPLCHGLLSPAPEQGRWSLAWLRPPPRLWPRGRGCSPLCVPRTPLCPAECRLPGAGGCWAAGFCFCRVVEEEEGAGAGTGGLRGG